MVKLLGFVLVVYILFKMFKSDLRKMKDSRKKKAPETQEAPEAPEAGNSGVMVRDPICGTYVSKDNAVRVKDGESTYCFCSYDCRDAFLKQLQAGQDTKES